MTDKGRRGKVDIHTFDAAFSEFLHIGAGLVDDPTIQRVGMSFCFDVLHHLLRVEIAALPVARPKQRLQGCYALIDDAVDGLEMYFDALLTYVDPCISVHFFFVCHASLVFLYDLALSLSGFPAAEALCMVL